MLPVPFLSCLTRWENIPVKHDYIFLPRTVIRIGSKLSSLPTTLIIFHPLQKSWSIFSFSYYIMPSAASWSSQLGSVLRILPSYLFLPHPAKALHLDRETGQPFHQRIPRTEAMPGMPSPISWWSPSLHHLWSLSDHTFFSSSLQITEKAGVPCPSPWLQKLENFAHNTVVLTGSTICKFLLLRISELCSSLDQGHSFSQSIL